MIPANDSNNSASSENVNTGPSQITITPTQEVGKGIQILKDDNEGYLAMITDKSGEVYYIVNRTVILNLYNVTGGNYSAPINVIYYNATVNGNNNSHIISKIVR